MAGFCNSCGDQFGVFKREHGCKQCGFSFCSNCLQNKAQVSKAGNKMLKVCKKCYDLLTGKTKTVVQKFDPPSVYTKRVAALDSAQQTGNKGKVSNLDQEIQQRLCALKEESSTSQPLHSEKEIEARLAKLKDENFEQRQQLSSLPKVKKKFAQEEVDDLLAEMCDEVELDQKFDPVAQTKARLENFKGTVVEASTSSQGKIFKTEELSEGLGPTTDADELEQLIAKAEKESRVEAERAMRELAQDSTLQQRLNELKEKKKEKARNNESFKEEDSEDDEAAAHRVMQQLTAEVALEDRIEGGAISYSAPQEDEFPWCCICNEDAALRCPGCDNDLYCRRCFREGHDTFCMEDHQPLAYKAPKVT